MRERLLRDEDSRPWLQRRHYKTQATGFATVGEAAAAGTEGAVAAESEAIYKAVDAKIKARMADGRDCA